MTPKSSTNPRLRFAGGHLLVCIAVAALAALLVFGRWYPAPFDAIARVAPIYLMLVGIDIVVGPALTLLVAHPAKPRAELLRDLAVIGLLQLGALGYGLHSMAAARPVALVFEVDLFRLVTASDIEPASLADAPASLRELSWSGPRPMVAVKPTDPAEQLRTIELGLAGVPLAALPKHWGEYAAQSAAIWQKARPVQPLLARYPNLEADVAAIARDAKQPVESLRFLPLVSRQASWVALVAEPQARVVGYLPVDGFF